jgi:hypothetical protein
MQVGTQNSTASDDIIAGIAGKYKNKTSMRLRHTRFSVKFHSINRLDNHHTFANPLSGGPVSESLAYCLCGCCSWNYPNDNGKYYRAEGDGQ